MRPRDAVLVGPFAARVTSVDDRRPGLRGSRRWPSSIISRIGLAGFGGHMLATAPSMITLAAISSVTAEGG
jgi:hypothetical protein